MNKNDFKNPLIQSGAVLLFVFLLISIVAGSESEGVFGSIGSLISGLISAVVFLVALCIAIIFSIAVIVGLYIAAVSFYSVDKGRDLLEHLKDFLASIYGKVTGSKISLTKSFPRKTKTDEESEVEPAAVPPQPAVGPANRPFASLESRLDNIDAKMAELKHTIAVNAEQIINLQLRVDEPAGNAEIEDQIAALEVDQEKFAAQLAKLTGLLEENTAALQKLEQQIADEHDRLKDDLATLQEKTSVPEVVSGILSYIDLPEDRDKITEKAKEAVSRGMTYAQIDDFFKASLSPEIYKELAAHPRLTKDFLRSIKKKF